MAIQDFEVIQGHVFSGQWKGDKGLSSFKCSWWAPKDACVLKQSA